MCPGGSEDVMLFCQLAMLPLYCAHALDCASRFVTYSLMEHRPLSLRHSACTTLMAGYARGRLFSPRLTNQRSPEWAMQGYSLQTLQRSFTFGKQARARARQRPQPAASVEGQQEPQARASGASSAAADSGLRRLVVYKGRKVLHGPPARPDPLRLSCMQCQSIERSRRLPST